MTGEIHNVLTDCLAIPLSVDILSSPGPTIRSSQLSAILPPSLPLLVPQHSPQDLAARTLGDDVDKLHAAGEPLVAGLLLLDEAGDVAAQHGVRLLQPHLGGLDDKGLGHLAGALVGHGDHRAVGDGGVVEQAGFEFGGRDLEALFYWWSVEVRVGEGVEV